jgi:adenylosuccinate lyase
MTFHLNSPLFANVFGTQEMRELFDQRSFVETFLKVEAALARAEAGAGLIPASAAEAISSKATIEYINSERVAANVERHGLLSVAIIEAWRSEFDASGEYVHWGATTQDISDTVLVLLCREAHRAVMRDVDTVRAALESLIENHRETPMVGRTQFRQGPPVTFGLAAATWLDELDRHAVRLRELTERLFVVQLAGASGTVAALGEAGPEVREQFAAELDLRAPEVGWTATRDRFVELLSMLSGLAGTLARIARQLLFLGRPEINELSEPLPGGEIGSSTNPHKRNPVYSQHTVGLARLVRGLADVMSELAEAHDERDRTTWYVEFAVLPEAFVYLGRMLANTNCALSGLTVDAEAMEQTIGEAGPLIASEAVMMALAEPLGRQTAHELVREHALRTSDGDGERSFINSLRADPRVTGRLSTDDLVSLTDPTTYLGSAAAFATAVLNRDRVSESEDEG